MAPRFEKTDVSRLIQYDDDDIREMARDCDFYTYLEFFSQPPDPDITDEYTWDCLSVYHGYIDAHTPIRYGIELEVDRKCNGRWFDFVTAMTNVTRYCIRVDNDAEKFDGFLFIKPETAISECGIELVSVPATLPTHILDFDWSDILEGLREANYGSARPEQKGYHILNNIPTVCALHVHINRQDLIHAAGGDERAIEILLYLVERFRKELLVLSRRYRKQFYYWTCPYSVSNKHSQMRRSQLGVKGYPVVKLPTPQNGRTLREFYNKCSNVAARFDPNKARSFQSNREIRYRTLNLTPPETLEFRLWMGTVDDYAFHSSLMITDMFVHMALDLCRYDDDYILSLDWDFVDTYASEYYCNNTTLHDESIYSTEFLEPADEDLFYEALQLPKLYMSRMHLYTQKYRQPWTCYGEPGRF